MNLKIKRVWYLADGIISNVFTEDGTHLLTTLEHAYSDGAGEWEPKVPPGVFECVRGTHALHDGREFETFEVTGVKGHAGILFHHGNWNEDSEGCILTGDALTEAPDPKNGGAVADLVTNTDAAFARFMAAEAGEATFSLTVEA